MKRFSEDLDFSLLKNDKQFKLHYICKLKITTKWQKNSGKHGGEING